MQPHRTNAQVKTRRETVLALEFNCHSQTIVLYLADHYNSPYVWREPCQNAQRAGSPDVFYRDEVPRLPKSILQGGQRRLFLASIWEHPSQPEADAPLAQTSSRLRSVVTALRVTDVFWFDLASTRWLSERIPSHRLLTSSVSHLTSHGFISPNRACAPI
jgi:hypothetical protein